MLRNFRKAMALVLGSLLMSTTAFADATGLWQGYATWSYDGASVPCILSIRFQENDSVLRRHKGQLACDLVTMYSDPLLWQKDGSGLTLEGQAAGHWTPQGFETHELYDENVKVVTQLNTVTGEYREVWSRINDGAEIYDVRGQLKRSK